MSETIKFHLLQEEICKFLLSQVLNYYGIDPSKTEPVLLQSYPAFKLIATVCSLSSKCI